MGKIIIPKSEKEFSEAKDGDLVRVVARGEITRIKLLVYLRAGETDNPLNPKDEFLEQGEKNPLLINSWRSERKYLMFDDGVEFNSLHVDYSRYGLTDLGFTKRLDLLLRAEKIDMNELQKLRRFIESAYELGGIKN